MKRILLLLPLPLLAAEPRFVTIHENEPLVVKSGEAVELVAGAGYNAAITVSRPNGPATGLQLKPDGQFGPFAYAGPATIAVWETQNIGGGFSGWATFRVWPGFTDPQAVALIPPGTNTVTVRLEASTNLVTWSAVHEVTLTNVPAATFYRAKASP